MATKDRQNHADADAAHLESLGYKQRLKRTLGTFDGFAFAFSYFSVISNLTIIFGLGLALGGPAFLWTWPVVVAGMLLVTLLFSELAATYPMAGSAYNWSKALAKSKATSWLTGWLVMFAVIVAFAAMSPAFGLLLPQVWSGFQVYGDGTGKYDFATNTVILGSVFIVISCIVNSIGVKWVGFVNSWVIRLEIVATLVFVIAFVVKIQHGPSALFQTAGLGESHSWGYAGAFLAAGVASAFSLVGMDAASDMAEETVNPRKAAPRSMLYAVLSAAVAFFVMGALALMAVSNPSDAKYAIGGFSQVIIDVYGATWGKVSLIIIILALVSAALAVQSFAIRVTFGMARDNNLPGGARLSAVNERTGTPVFLTIVIGVLAIGILLINIRQTQIIAALASTTVALMYLAYLGVLVPMLFARKRGDWPKQETVDAGYFSLGRWGWPVNIAAVIFLVVGFLNLAWPRRDVFNPLPPYHWYLQWSGSVFTAIILAAGLGLYWFYQRHKTGVVAEHTAVSAATPGPLSPEATQVTTTIAVAIEQE